MKRTKPELQGPWIATWASDGLRVNGELWPVLRRGACWANQTIYLVGSAPWLDLGAMLLDPAQADDLLVAPWRGKPNGLTWTCEGGTAQLIDGDAWALPAQPEDAADELMRLADVIRNEEALAARGWFPAAAGLGGALARSELRTQLRQLRPRWRALARAGFHAGPQLALRGGAANVAHLDRVEAYLNAFFAPMPVPGSYKSIQYGVQWKNLRRYDGFVLASVHVKSEAALPPLPVRWITGTVWPIGVFTGCWPIALVREAEDAGEVVVRHVIDAQICSMAPWLAPLGDRIASVDDKRLRKLLYTRTYGLFAAAGRWTARAPWRPDHAIDRYVSSDAWAWTHTAPEPFSHRYQPLYRPDLAAMISAHNCRAMLRAIRALPPESIHLAHVDALWVDSDKASLVTDQGGWQIKHTGKLRVFGTGTYIHAGRARAQGVPGAHDPELLALALDARAVAPGCSSAEANRAWTHGGPLASADATSQAAPVYQGQQLRHVPTWLREVWSAGNWRARGTEDVQLDTLAITLDADPDATKARLAALLADAQAAHVQDQEIEHEMHKDKVVSELREKERQLARLVYGPGADG